MAALRNASHATDGTDTVADETPAGVDAGTDIRRLTSRLDIFRWGHAMIRPKPGFITSRQRVEASRPDGRIHFANTDLSGIALFEEAFDHGCRAADEVLAEFPRSV